MLTHRGGWNSATIATAVLQQAKLTAIPNVHACRRRSAPRGSLMQVPSL
jgi:hypothetical protein